MSFRSYTNLVNALFIIVSSFCFGFGSADSTITRTRFIRDSETITSNDGAFKLGFISFVNSSTNRYLGIWYLNQSDVVWVANREQPLKDSAGSLKISEDGNLVVLDGNNQTIWSSNITKTASSNLTAQLQDIGNLVLQDGITGEILWQSFDHPWSTVIPKMRLTINRITGKRITVTSSKSLSDPSPWIFSVSLERPSTPEVFLWVNGTRPYWRTGPWNGRVFIGAPQMSTGYLYGWSIGNGDDGTVSLTYSFLDPAAFGTLSLNSEGKIDMVRWYNRTKVLKMAIPISDCDAYGLCGPFGSCNGESTPICSCLSGYDPRNLEEWNRQNWTSGCVRKTLLQCERVKNGSEAGEKDGFLKLETMKVPDFAERTGAEDHCDTQCLENCSCIAYAYDPYIGCMYWSRGLIDLQKFSSGGVDLYIRLAHSELGKEQPESHTQRMIEDQKPTKLDELPLFDFEVLAAATNDFHLANTLGKGGFGQVYKGELGDGQEIAVKRLSRASGQGLEEFMNEVKVISKLQHRNLVRLLGCCIEGDEKMLIYEFMPNKSLDAFLFDPQQKKLLDWRTRFSIIEGVARDEVNTRRIVGTYGYMSPEYAMEGLFSEKSDVYSFGILLLEIVSGKRNNKFYNNAQTLNLTGYAWRLWNQDKIFSLIDPEISDQGFEHQILRCIHIGLLCVQEVARERPSMTTVVSMLNSEIINLPPPSHVAFINRQSSSSLECSTSESHGKYSANNVTLTDIQGR
ncbi:hypothetical protein L6164_036532 [Bauhinia variegata]|uniref:Uncharacterized protein n=1 Tax=Bauhinia variegata TaxID=167791 RepID=A0ACB9KHD3_BAUVA|nr:hypothetical protein L6164_036532 [Bauhinia variegata]